MFCVSSYGRLSQGLRHQGLRRGRYNPLTHGTLSSTVQACCHSELGCAVWTDRLRLERIESFPALPAHPKVPDRRRCSARWTGKSVASRRFQNTRQRLRLSQSSPATRQDEHRQDSKPDGLHSQSENNKPSHADKTDDRGHHQTAGPSHRKPEQGPKNLTAVQWIDRQQIENQQD